MKVAIDTRWTNFPQTGVGNYIVNLLKAIVKIKNSSEFVLFGNSVPGIPVKTIKISGFKKKLIQGLWKTVGFPSLESLTGKVDLVHFTNGTAAPTKLPYVLTVFDLSYLYYPETIEPKNLNFLKRFVPASLEKAVKIIAISTATKNDLVKFFGQSLVQKTEVIPLGVEELFFQPCLEDRWPQLTKKFKIREPYLLTVSTLEPRKNLSFLIQVYRQISKLKEIQLVIVGQTGWGIIPAEIVDSEPGKVVLTGFVTKEELHQLYSHAEIFLFPSLYEGFGLPVLEAAAAKLPVVASNVGALPEVAGKAGILLPVNEKSVWFKTILNLLDNPQQRERMSQLGPIQAKKFSWDKTARKTVEVYYKGTF